MWFGNLNNDISPDFYSMRIGLWIWNQNFGIPWNHSKRVDGTFFISHREFNTTKQQRNHFKSDMDSNSLLLFHTILFDSNGVEHTIRIKIWTAVISLLAKLYSCIYQMKIHAEIFYCLVIISNSKLSCMHTNRIHIITHHGSAGK